MKKIGKLMALLALASFLLIPQLAGAITITSGDYIKLVSYNGIGNGGIMNTQVSHDAGTSVAFSYDTFCIQDNVFITPGIWYPIAEVSSNVGFFDVPPAAGSGPLVGVIDYLFYRYRTGAYTTEFASKASQADFQKLIWSIQGTGAFFDSVGTPWAADEDAYAIDASLRHPWGTEVINIVSGYNPTRGFYGPDIQNVLYNPVPEPATMLLLGLGLVGLAGVRRMFKK